MAKAGSLTYDTKLDTSGFQKGVKEIEGKTKSSGASVKNIVAGLGITKLVTKAIGTIKNSIDGAVSRLDTMNNFSKVMSNLGISAQQSQKAIDKLSKGLEGIPTSLDAGALAVQRFTSKNGDVQKSADIFLAVNDAILAGGASTQIQESALEQLSQAYSRGKFEMNEWRALQIAMPAQLKQVATAMGLTTDQLGEMLRTGDNTGKVFDEFIDTIIKMDKTGVKGFKSLKEQARNTTGGIQTSITNMRTAITRGVADMIQQFDKALKNKGLGGISGVISEIGKKAEGLFKNVSKWIPKAIDLISGLFNIMNKLKPVILAVVSAFVLYRTTLVAIEAINIATSIVKSVTAFISLATQIRSANDAMMLLNITMNANPVGLIVAGVAALTTALIVFSKQSDSSSKALKEVNKTIDDYNEKQKELSKQKDETLSKGLQEVYHYQNLYEELQKITDENGKVKKGYEERANVIAGQLSEALGTEIKITDGVIEKYQGLKKEINETLEYKKALAYFNAHEAEYNEAVSKETEYRNNYNKALKNSNERQKEYNDSLELYAEKLGVSKEELDLVAKGQLAVRDSSKEMQNAYYGKEGTWWKATNDLEKYRKKLNEADEALEQSGKIYANNQETIYNYNTAQQHLADGNYEAMYKIYNDTVTFNAKTQESNNQKYEKSKSDWESYRQYLKDNQSKFSEDFLKSENERIDKEIGILEDEKNKANEKIKQKNKQIYDTTLTGINDQLKALTDKKYEFRDAGNGNVRLYVNGMAKGQPISEKTASKLAEGAVDQIKNKKASAEQAGEFLIEGVNFGINNRKKQNTVFASMGAFATTLLGTLKSGLQEQSPSKASKQYGEWLLEGLNIGIDNEKQEVLDNVDDFSNDIVDRMANAVNVQTGKMAFSGTAGSVNQILTATGTTTVINENKLLLDGDVVYENQKKVSARKNLQTQFGGAYNVSN